MVKPQPTVGKIIGSLFEGGLVDLSLIQSYMDHYVGHVWIRQEQPEPKLVSHGAQVLLYLTYLQVWAYVDRSGLATLGMMRYPTTKTRAW